VNHLTHTMAGLFPAMHFNQTTKTFNAEAAEVRGESASNPMTVPEVVFSCKTVFLRSLELVLQNAQSWGKGDASPTSLQSGKQEIRKRIVAVLVGRS